MKISEFDFTSEIVRIPDLEKNEIIVVEIVLNALRFRRDHGLRKREVFEDTRWRIDFSKDVAVVRDHSKVTILICVDDLSGIANAQIIDIGVECPLLGRFHYFFE